MLKMYGCRPLLIDTLKRGTLIFLLNNICQVLTVVPHSESIDCYIERIDKSGDESDHGSVGWWILYEPNIFNNCSDMMWSGHTAHTIQAFFIIYAICGRKWWLYGLFFLVFATLVIGMISIRYHYTMDIFVACVITVFALRDVCHEKYFGSEQKYVAVMVGDLHDRAERPGHSRSGKGRAAIAPAAVKIRL